MGSIGIFVAQTGGRKLIFRQPNNKKNILMDWGPVKKKKKNYCVKTSGAYPEGSYANYSKIT